MNDKVITGCNNCPHATFIRDVEDYRKDGGYCSLRPLNDQQVSTGDFLRQRRPPLCPLPNPFLEMTKEIASKFEDAVSEAESYSNAYKDLIRQQIGTAIKDLQEVIGDKYDDDFFSSSEKWLPSSRSC